MLPYRTITATAFAVALLGAAPLRADDQTAWVKVDGEGKVTAEPDTAHFSVGVTTLGATPAEALHANTAATEQTLATLKKLGIQKEDLQTNYLSLSPVYSTERAERRRITSYQAHNLIDVKLKNVSEAGAIFDKVVTAGANDVGGISFSVREATALYDEARRRALADARRKAEIYASAAGAKLGRLLRIDDTEPQSRYGDQVGGEEEIVVPGGGRPVPIEPGKLTYSETLRATWALQQ